MIDWKWISEKLSLTDSWMFTYIKIDTFYKKNKSLTNKKNDEINLNLSSFFKNLENNETKWEIFF